MSRPLTFAALISAAGLALAGVSAPCAAQQTERDCTLTVAQAGQTIQSTGAIISSVRKDREDSPNNPFSAKDLIVFFVGSMSGTEKANQKSADLMNSPGIQGKIASAIFRACHSVVTISFVMTATDWNSSFFRGSSNSAIKGTCIDPDRHRTKEPLWGYYPCL